MAMDMAVALKISAGVTGQQAVDQLRTSLDKLDGAAQQVGRGFALAKTAVAGFIGLQAVQGIARLGTALLDTADRLNDISQQTGYTVEELSKLEYAAKLSGTSLDAVQAGMGKVAAKAVEAAAGNKQAALAFQALGVNVKDTQGAMRSTVDIMGDVGEALSEITDNTVRTAVAREIFGKNADALIPFLMNMREAQDEAQKLGATISGDFANKAAQFNDNLDRMAYQLRGIGNTILAELLPGMNALAESMQKQQDGGALQLFASGIRVAFETIVVLGGNVIYVFREIGHEVAGVGRQLMALAKLDFKEFGRIGDQMLADAKRRRQEIDAWSESIINAGKAGAGRGNINPPAATPEGRKISLDMFKGAAGEDEETRKARERERLLQGLEDAVLKLRDGEDALTISRLKGLNASDAQIEKAKDLLAVLKAFQNDKEVERIFQGIIDETNKLTKSEEELLIAKLRSNGATDAQIEVSRRAFRELVRQRELDKQRKEDEKSKEASARFVQQQEETRVQILDSLNDQITSIVYGEEALAISRFRAAGATDEEVQRLRDLQRELKQVKQAKDDMEEGRALRHSVRTPEEKMNDDIERFRQLLNGNKIDLETYTRAVNQARDAYLEFGKKGKDAMDELKQAVEGWGRSAADAFVKFAFDANSSTKSVKDQFKELANSILQDIARMLIYKNITGPLFNAIGAMMPSFANGGIMTSDGAVPLNRYASGGIARSPQLALFGEGRMPEAYVPLPDGRSIPVTMEGGGGTSVVVNVNMQTGQEQTDAGDQRGANLGNVIASVVKQELINQRRPGGLLAAA